MKGQALYTVNVRAEAPATNAREEAAEMYFISRLRNLELKAELQLDHKLLFHLTFMLFRKNGSDS